MFCDSGSNGLDTTSTPSLPTTDISGLDDAYKVGKLTSEEKKLKIKKYMKKRNERNFNKTIKVCFNSYFSLNPNLFKTYLDFSCICISISMLVERHWRTVGQE